FAATLLSSLFPLWVPTSTFIYVRCTIYDLFPVILPFIHSLGILTCGIFSNHKYNSFQHEHATIGNHLFSVVLVKVTFRPIKGEGNDKMKEEGNTILCIDVSTFYLFAE
ncbi:hypothetical protein ACJX0J_040976, partial [Zea mays]